MEVARRYTQIEIVAVDAMQVYRGMDIGTAKPTAADRSEVPHHGLDLVDPSASFTVSDFQSAATSSFVDIATRHGTALLVAGTGLYLSTVINGLHLPGAWPEVRERLEQEAEHDLGGLFARLQQVDPDAASKMEPSNTRRIVRALEVWEGSGRPFSSFGPGMDAYPESPISQIGLRWPRSVLAARIETRVHRMMEGGLLAEVRGLYRPGSLSRTAAQALGYKEIIDHLEGRCSLDEAVATIITRTRQFAVRQDRWFRRDPRIRWIDIETDSLEALPVMQQAVGAA
jgi:tRNA dimethylallyltransferase